MLKNTTLSKIAILFQKSQIFDVVALIHVKETKLLLKYLTSQKHRMQVATLFMQIKLNENFLKCKGVDQFELQML